MVLRGQVQSQGTTGGTAGNEGLAETQTGMVALPLL